MNVAFYRRVIEQCFPEFAVFDIRFGGGGSFRMFEVNRDWIFRFPHGGDGPELIRREKWLYDCLQPLLSLPIPRYTYFSDQGCDLFPWPVAGYRRLHGVSFESLELGSTRALRLAAQIAVFLSELHSLTAGQLAEARFALFDPERAAAAQRRFYEQIQTHAFAILSPAQRAWTRDLFESFLNNPQSWDFFPVLIHGDFDSSNILCDPAGETIVGIIDFEETGFGDPAWDFCALRAEFGPAFLDRLLTAYDGPVGGGLLERIEFHARRIIFCELLYGLEVSESDYVAHGLTRLRRAMAGDDVIEGWLRRSTSATRQPSGFPS